jgi:O-antigen/teichoic acid export membrane protein
MAGSATFTLVAQAVRVAATMLLTVLVSRLLGPESLGLLTLGLTIATTATIVACAGVDQGVIYFVARAQPVTGAMAQPDGAAAAIRTALLITAVGGAGLGALGVLLAPWLAGDVFQAPELRPILLILAAAVPLACVFAAALGALQGSFRIVQRAVVEWILFPVLTLVLAAGLLLRDGGIQGVAVAYVAAWTVSALVAVSAALRIPGKTRPLIVRPLLAFSLPLMFSLLTGYLLFHIDVLMLGALASLREVGLYSVATRLALPLFLVLDSVARAFAPLAAHLYSHDQSRRLATVYAAATEWVLAINVPAGVLIAVNAEPILALFGQEFVAAAPALRVLSAGIVVATACGTAASMLTMTRWQRLEMFDNLLLLSLNVVLNLMLVPRFGALGAAAATASSAGAVYALKVVQARWLLGVQPFRWRQLATLALAGACAALAWAATWPFALASTTALAARVGVFAASYVVLWWRWGVSPSSREVLQAIVGRNRSA